MHTRPRVALFAIIVCFVTGACTACQASSAPQATPEAHFSLHHRNTAAALSQEEQALYDSTVGELLTQDLWTARDTYDAAHYLMVPMHYAFASGNTRYVEAFADFFARFTADVTGEDVHGFQTGGTLNIMQFYYFTTQFIVLCVRYGYESLVPADVIPLITTKMEAFYYEMPGNWNCEPTRQEHFQQVLAGKEYPYSYYRCIDDFDTFFWGVCAI